MNLQEAKAAFPYIEYLEEQVPGTIGIKSGISGKTYLKHNVEGELRRRQAIRLIKLHLETLYPFLYFRAGRTQGIGTGAWHIWVARIKGGQRRDWEAVGKIEEYPFTVGQHETLRSANAEAGKAQQEGMFFCSQCHQAKPLAEKGGSHWAEVLCDVCATPAWKRRAKEDRCYLTW